MKKILIIASLISFSFAEAETHNGTTASGTVPFAASWDLTETDNTAAFPATAVADYDNGYITIADYIQITDFDCNANFSVTISRGAWSIPVDYSDDGNKQASGNPTDDDTDVLVYVDNVTAGYGAGGLAAQGGWASDYTAIGNAGSASTIIAGGTTGTDLGHGVEDAAADINLRVLMDWAKDVEGAYSVTATLTIVDTD